MPDPIPSLYNVLNVNRNLPNGGGQFNVANSTPSGAIAPPTLTPPSMSPPADIMSYLNSIGRGNKTSAPVSNPVTIDNPTGSSGTTTFPTASNTGSNIVDGVDIDALINKYTKKSPYSDSPSGSGYASNGVRPNAPLDFMALREEQLRDRANGTGLYAIPQGVSLSPDQVLGLRSMADNHYRDLMQSAVDYSKEMKSTTKTPAYGIDSDLAGMSTNSVNLLYKMSDDFNSHPIAKNFNVIQRSSSAANNIINDINSRPDKKATAGDDMSLMYLFAKAQDPESVVRESEYNNVGEYFSTLPQQVQFKLSTIYKTQPDGRLTDTARANIAKGIKTLYETNKQQYDNLRTNTVDRMKRVAGKDVSSSFLNSYEDAYDKSGSSPGSFNSSDSEGWF